MRYYKYYYRIKNSGGMVLTSFSSTSPVHTVWVKLGIHLVIKKTERGVWVNKFPFSESELDTWGEEELINRYRNIKDKRFLLNSARFPWAASTQENALRDFKLRKLKQTNILKQNLKHVEDALEIANGLDG